MATRPIFIPTAVGNRFVIEKIVDFTWHPGFSPTQKKKSIRSLHEEAGIQGISPIIEISTKSDDELGIKLSAFNLRINIPSLGAVPLEAVFQGSKVFENGGPYTDIYSFNGRQAKKDARLRESGKLLHFDFLGNIWELEPKTAFYDWIYLQAILKHSNLINNLIDYSGFTDIEFNPKKSINCQARSCALVTSLIERGLLENALSDPENFLLTIWGKRINKDQNSDIEQGSLF
jgi:hypothetical protein